MLALFNDVDSLSVAGQTSTNIKSTNGGSRRWSRGLHDAKLTCKIISHTVSSAASSPMSPAVTAGLLPASAAEGFPALDFIQDPGEARIMFADSFNDERLLWLFPFLSFSQNRNITDWVFRVNFLEESRRCQVQLTWQLCTDSPS